MGISILRCRRALVGIFKCAAINRYARVGFLVGFGLVLAMTTVACGSPSHDLAQAVHPSSPRTQESCAYAEAHPEVPQYVPCYLGCEDVGQIKNEDCFVAQRALDGTVWTTPLDSLEVPAYPSRVTREGWRNRDGARRRSRR